MQALWTELATRAGLQLTEPQQALLARYLDLLLAANEKMNLTRIVDRASAEVQHVGDALTVLPFLPREPHTLADVGTGGGVPGIPLAIARPDVQVTLVEATKKKAVFLQETAQTLGLANLRVIDQRAEDVGRGELRESFDVAVSRAVGELVWVAEWCLPLAKKGGQVLAMKGPKVQEEIPAARRAIHVLGGGAPAVHPVELPGAQGHVIVVIKKGGTTPANYPRLASVAKSKPIK